MKELIALYNDQTIKEKFIGLSIEDGKKFLFDFLSDIPVGQELSKVWTKFAIWLLEDEKYGVINYANNEESKQNIKSIIELYKNKENVSIDEWRNAGVAAYSSAAAAIVDAFDYSYAYGAYAAASAACAVVDEYNYGSYGAYASVEAAIESAIEAYAYADTYCYSDYKSKKNLIKKIQHDKLVELINECI